MIKTSRDIKVGQFYKALEADGYYYVGIKFGSGKRLVVINMDDREIGPSTDPLFPNERSMYKEWNFQPCTQEEAMNAK